MRSVLAGYEVPERLEAAFADPNQYVVAGELSGALLGVGIVSAQPFLPDAPLAKVVVLFVEPEARGVGLGEAMMGAMVEWAIGQGCTGIDAMALPGSREAKAFFETHGMVARALIMHRSLPTPGQSAPRRRQPTERSLPPGEGRA